MAYVRREELLWTQLPESDECLPDSECREELYESPLGIHH